MKLNKFFIITGKLWFILLFLCMNCSKNENTPAPPIQPPPPPPANNNIVYVSPNPDGGIYTQNESGNNQDILLAIGAADSVAYANWGQDQRVYFCGRLEGDVRLQIYSIKSDGSDLKKVFDDSDNEYSQLHVSQNGSLLYIKKASENSSAIYISKADGSEEAKIMDIENFTVSSMSWVPMAFRIIFVSDEPVTAGGAKVSNMYYITANGSQKLKITNNDNPLAVYDEPYFCPDGSLLAYSFTTDISNAGYSVYMCNPEFAWSTLILESNESTSWSTGNWSQDIQWILLTDKQNKLFKIRSGDESNLTALNSTNVFKPKLKNFAH